MAGALVLAGGGVAGIAWEIGVLFGIEETDPELAARLFATETTFIGTSAGSVVASQVAGGVSLEELFDQQRANTSAEVGAVFDAEEFGRTIARLLEGATSALDARQRVGHFAMEVDISASADRRRIIDSRLERKTWPEHRLLITAVDAESGELRIFDRESGVDLIDAIGASCAVPGVWPTVEIESHRYTDGGVRTISNADLAAGCDPVLILVPSPEVAAVAAVSDWELAALEPGAVRIVFADDTSVAAFGNNPLDPATQSASADAGREQGRRIATDLAGFWS